MSSSEIKIVHFDQKLLEGFETFSKLVHPKEKGLEWRMKWFAFANPWGLTESQYPGLATVTADNNEVIGQFLMTPFEFYIRGKKYMGNFGYDFFVKEEFRSRGAGALLFVQGVRMYKPFIGVGLTQVVEKISKAAGIQMIGQFKKFIWSPNPIALGSKFLKTKWMSGPTEMRLDKNNDQYPETVDAGFKFTRVTQISEGFGPSFSEEVLEPVRSKEFFTWRFVNAPIRYHVYAHQSPDARMYLIVRPVVYEGMRLLLIVDYRFDKGKWDHLDVILRAAKSIATKVRLDGVVTASTCVPVEEALIRERFIAAGRPSSVIAYLPSEDFSPPVTSVCLTMADADLDFSFTEDS